MFGLRLVGTTILWQVAAVTAAPAQSLNLEALREIDAFAESFCGKFLIGKPGLDGHSNGAEQIAFRARDCGMEIDYEGIRLTPDEIIAAARREQPHVIGLSILSGSHIPLVADLMARIAAEGLTHIPVLVGGIIPDDDAARLRAMGVAKVYTPKDFELNRIMLDIVALADPEAMAAE